MKTPKGVLFLFLACFFASGISARAEVGFSFSLPTQTSQYSFIRGPQRGISTFGDQAIITLTSPARAEKAEFDSLYTSAILRIQVDSTDIITSLPMSYEKYRDMRLAYEIRREFVDQTVKGFKSAAQARSGEGIAIDVPFKIKSKTFRRIFGGDNIGLRVQGSITIDGKYRQQKFDQLQAANQRNTSNNFNIDMTQRFTIAGKIGEKVQVDVNQDSERLFDFENSLKLTYTGDKDEIIQKVEAGNVSLSLGTNLATFSGQNKGLFGIKTEAKVGALKLTGIASLERGQKNRQKPNESSRRASWSENDFLQNVYFWITDTTFVTSDSSRSVDGFRENYRRYINRQHVTPEHQLSAIDVWVTTGGSGNQQGVETSGGFAVILQNIDSLAFPRGTVQTSQVGVDGTWRRLTPQTEYVSYPELGYIRLRTPLQSDVALAVSFRTAAGDTFGSQTVGTDGVRLVLIKPRTAQPTDPTWNLMFRHVYSLQTTGIQDPENFKLKIIRGESVGGIEEEGPDASQTYLKFFGFDELSTTGTGSDGNIDNLSSIFNPEFGEIHFLDLTPFDPSGFYELRSDGGVDTVVWGLADLQAASSDTTGYIDQGLYTQPYTTVQSSGRLWRFQTEYKGTTSQYDLGPLVLEGSEEITLNGNRLMRGSDYTIDYLSGQLKILNESAKAANANLEITYESGQVFQLDRKTLLGARAEYELWQDSYIGGMMLHLNEKSLDQRVRIGNEPIRNTLYDMDTQLKFKPNFLTAIADRLPLVRTNAASEFVIDGEAAKVFPNPNSLSNTATGDANGVAFLDDFEASRRSVPLGMQRRNWAMSSIPVDPGVDSLRGRFRWWNPRPEDQVKVQDVFPRREVNSQVADRLQSLILEYAPVGATDDEKARSWGGVMRYLGAGYEDQSRAQFLEFWIQLPPRPQGRLVVDLGNISEDALPNDTMNTEDRPVSGEVVSSPRTEYGDGILAREEDTGIDGVGLPDPADSAFWNGPTKPKVPSMDDWQYSIGSGDYLRINGTENSLNDESSNFPDSEDLNGNQSLDQVNEYFSYSIDLNSIDYIVGGDDNVNRWRLFRIPIDTDDPRVLRVVGNPTLTNIRFARMYLTGITDSVRIQIVQNDIVSNEWLPDFLPDSVEYVSAAVINNHENPGYYSPPGVQGEIDPITNLRQREQSLALKINHLGSSGAPKEFFVAKNLFQQINMIEYKRLKMFIHGGGEDETQFTDGQYQLVLRLGTSYSNTDANYYDIVKTIYKGWDARNQIDIAMNDLSILSAWRDDPTRADYDSVTAAGFKKYGVVLDSINFPQDSLIINGRPSLQNVGFIALGVRSGKHYNNFEDEIWVDELRVSDIYKDPGTAGEITTSLKVADLLTASAAYTKRDADFHNVNTRTGDQRTSETMRGSLGLSLQKFGLEQYGFALPVNINYTETDAVPKYVPNTDARVDQDNPDTTVVSKQITTTYNASFTKSGNSPNPLVRWTAEKLRLTWDHSDSRSKDHLTLKQEQKTTNARAEYTFPTARGRGIAPLWFLNGIPLLSQIGNPHIFYKPKQLSGSFAARRTQAERQTRVGQRTLSPDFTTTGAAAVGWDITEALGTGFTQTYGWTQVENTFLDSDNDGVVDSAVARAKEWKKLRLNPDELNGETWNWNNTYSPQLASWFAPTLNYSSTYNWARQNQGGSRNPAQQSQNQNLQNSRNMGGDVTLDLKSILGGGGGARGRGREPLRDQQNRRPIVNMDSTRTDSTRNDSLVAERAPGFSPLQFLGKALYPFKKGIGALDPVSLSYDNSLAHSRSAVSGQGSLAYRLGLDDDPGSAATRVVSTTGGTINSTETRNQTQDFTARSGIRVSRDIRTTYAWNRRITESKTTTSTKSTDQTYFWLADDNGIATEIPFTDVSVDWSGFERLPFLTKVARTVSLTSGLSSRYKEDWSGNPMTITNRNYSRQWNPLVGVNVSWLNSIDSQLRINSSSTFAEAAVTGNKSRGSTNGANATVSYTMRTGFRLPILWFGAMRLENSTTFSLNVDYSMTSAEKKDRGFTGWSPQRDEVSWSVQPRMNYTFSSTVQGGAQIQYQQTKDKITDRGSRLFEFGINVSIQIRG